jgi:hypothetical protein
MPLWVVVAVLPCGDARDPYAGEAPRALPQHEEDDREVVVPPVVREGVLVAGHRTLRPGERVP